jgi:hypothetical protein
MARVSRAICRFAASLLELQCGVTEPEANLSFTLWQINSGIVDVLQGQEGQPIATCTNEP